MPYTRPTGTDTAEPLKIGVLISGSGTNLQALMNIFMDADAAADVLGQTTPQGMVDAIRRHF